MPIKAPFFKRILAATGTPKTADPPVLVAAHLARRENARLHVVHAVTSAMISRNVRWPTQTATSSVSVAIPSFPAIAQELVFRYRTEFPELTMEDIRIVSGVAWEAIFRNACDLESHLIVVGPHNELETTRQLPYVKGPLGSTAEGVLRHARCPVMVINKSATTDKLEFRNVVVGVDFSRSCIGALCLAALLTVHFNSHIHPFHMLPIPPYPKYSRASLDFDLRRTQALFDRLCKQLLHDLEYHYQVKPGVAPHEALLNYAQKRRADLIVMGSHTKEKAGKWYPGSVVQKVSRLANCPVLVVSGPEALGPWKDEHRVMKLSGLQIR